MQNLTTGSVLFHLRDTRTASHVGRLAAAMPRIFRVVITTRSRGVSGRYNVVTHLRWWMGWREGGGVSPGQKLADPVSLSSSLSRSFP